MVDNSKLLIAYVKYSWGGASRTLEYAKRKGVEIDVYKRQMIGYRGRKPILLRLYGYLAVFRLVPFAVANHPVTVAVNEKRKVRTYFDRTVFIG